LDLIAPHIGGPLLQLQITGSLHCHPWQWKKACLINKTNSASGKYRRLLDASVIQPLSCPALGERTPKEGFVKQHAAMYP